MVGVTSNTECGLQQGNMGENLDVRCEGYLVAYKNQAYGMGESKSFA